LGSKNFIIITAFEKLIYFELHTPLDSFFPFLFSFKSFRFSFFFSSNNSSMFLIMQGSIWQAKQNQKQNITKTLTKQTKAGKKIK